ncbi:VWA domain-containing protein [bacterium SCSIO 12741]|nr:VWA domain-containing protein [bacterium SCSIO 12741]
MKFLASVFTLALLCLFSSYSWSQTEFTYHITVKNYRGQSQPNVRIWWKEQNTGEVLEARTNSTGQVEFEIPAGEWAVSLNGLPDYKQIRIKEGAMGSGSMTIAYDLATIQREEALRKARKGQTFESVDQTGKVYRQPSRGMAVVQIKVKNKEKKGVRDVPVSLLGPQKGVQYQSKTNSTGLASFQVPIGEAYIVDLDGIKNHGYTPEISRESIHSLSYTYVPTEIKEWEKNDTLIQSIKPDEPPTTARVQFKMQVNNLKKGGPIYLNQIGSNKVFYSKADADGKATFLLPKKEKYLIQFEFQRDVDVINLEKTSGLAHKFMQITYQPNPRLQYPERYLPTRESAFIQEFESFLTKNLPAPDHGKKIGLFLNWGNDRVKSTSREAVLQIGVKGTPEPVKRTKEVDLAFVIDKSGSMAGYDRLDAVKVSMANLIPDLIPGDRVGLYAFNETASERQPIGEVQNGALLKERVEELEAGGGTRIYNGLEMAFQKMLEIQSPDRPQQVILLTDGYGSRPPKEVVDMANSYTAKGIDISAIGVGNNYNYALLKLITQNHGGLLSQAVGGKEIEQTFRKQLNGIIAPVAENVVLSIQFNQKIRFKELFGAEVKKTEKDRVQVELGTVYRNYQKVTLAQFNLIKPDQSIENEPVTIELDYRDAETGKQERLTQKAYLKWEPATGRMQVILDREFKKLYAVAIMNQSIKVLIEALEKENFLEAKVAVEGCLDQVQELFPEAKDEDVKKLVDELTGYVLAVDQLAKNGNVKVVKN